MRKIYKLILCALNSDSELYCLMTLYINLSQHLMKVNHHSILAQEQRSRIFLFFFFDFRKSTSLPNLRRFILNL